MAISDQLYITAHLHQWHNRPQHVVYCCNQFPYISNTLQNIPACLHPQSVLVHLALQLQLMTFMSFWGAASKSVAVGISELLWYDTIWYDMYSKLNVHLQLYNICGTTKHIICKRHTQRHTDSNIHITVTINIVYTEVLPSPLSCIMCYYYILGAIYGDIPPLI